MYNSAIDKITSALSYLTFGIFGLIYLIFAHLTKKRISSFALFNIYQSMFISVIFAVFSLVYNMALEFISVIPFIGNLALKINLFLNGTPIYFDCTLTGLFITILLLYLMLLCLLNKKPFIPYISDIIHSNFGG